jgi:hypothetical protein
VGGDGAGVVIPGLRDEAGRVFPDCPKKDEAPKPMMVWCLSNRPSVSILPNARNPVYAFVGPIYRISKKNKRKIKI